MKRKSGWLMCLGAVLSTAAICVGGQSPNVSGTSDATTSTTAPVAWLYVSYGNNTAGYQAWPNGTLTAISGSPFSTNVNILAVNGKYLMGVSNAGHYVKTYQMQASGALKYITRIDYAHFINGGDCGPSNSIGFEHTGSWLYVRDWDSTCSNSGIQSFAINKSTGALTYLGFANDGVRPSSLRVPAFLSNDVDAYSASDEFCFYWGFFGYKRASNGMLNSVGDPVKNLPSPTSKFRSYIPNMMAADPTNHVAVHLTPGNPGDNCGTLLPQIATYTADASGYLTTASTYSNMPKSMVINPSDMRISPSGKLLAVGGQEGLQIFHFYGVSQATHYTNLITTAPISQLAWDKNNHLYAISQSANKIFVFTITPTGWGQAPGSPHALPSPDAMIVQPLPRN